MKKLINLAASLITGVTLMMSASAAMARDVDVRIVERPAYHQGRPHHVAPRHHGHYQRYDRHHRRPVPASVRRDRDGDGVPNRFDARPNNGPPARAYRDRDRDGDGVTNRYDRAPGNPYRY